MQKIHRHIIQTAAIEQQSDIQLMAANMIKLKSQIRQLTHEKHRQESYKIIGGDNEVSINQSITTPSPSNRIEYLQHAYKNYLMQSNLPKNHQQKMKILLQETISLGSAIALSQMVFYFKQALNIEILEQIQNKAFQGLLNTDSQEKIRVYGQLIAITGIQNEEICQYMAQNLIQQKMEFDLAFLILSNQGQMGLAYLYDIANRDIIAISQKVLDYLSRTQSIVVSLIIPNILEEAISNSNYKYRDIALLILNRLGPIIQNSQYLQKLTHLIKDPTVNKKFLFAAIRSTGLEGQKILIDVVSLKMYSEEIICLALGVMSWKIPSQQALRIKAISYTSQNCFLPGKLYQFEGQIQPWDFQTQICYDSLCLSAHGFLSQIQCYLKLGKFQQYKSINNKSLMQLFDVLKLEEIQKVQISEQIIKTLIYLLKSKSNKIKQTCLLEIGNIGFPQGASAIQIVTKCLWDNDSSIRSAACWTLSRICKQNQSRKTQMKLNQLLRDHFWKVRTSACITIGIIIKNPQDTTIQNLIKTLQDNSIPKATICQTLAKIGAEELLLQILKGSYPNDYKLRQAIISSFKNISLKNPIINNIIEELLRFSREQRVQIRQSCLITLNQLQTKVQHEKYHSISYFNTKYLLPFYYCFLQDSSAKIRQIASQSILRFGSQVQLLFIEGMAKAQPLTKIQCIKCLGKLGVQNFRAIILGLRDEDQRVRKIASETIMNNFQVEEIIQEFGQRQNHSISLLCNLRQILNSDLQFEGLKQYLKLIIDGLQYNRKYGKIKHRNENTLLNQ